MILQFADISSCIRPLTASTLPPAVISSMELESSFIIVDEIDPNEIKPVLVPKTSKKVNPLTTTTESDEEFWPSFYSA